jgi:hypothetical protein
MIDPTTGDLNFEPVNIGQALGVLADVVATYVCSARNSAIEDATTAAQLNITIFLHSLLMRSKDKAKMADLLEIVAAELRETAKSEPHADVPADRSAT